jgi:hypothetical protein
MFDLPIVEIATGLALVYLMLSLIVSALNEGIATVFAMRARTLRMGLEQLLGEARAQELSDHPLVAGLKPKSWMTWHQRPTYIPRTVFVTTVLDLFANPSRPAAAVEPNAQPSIDLRSTIGAIQEQNLRRALLALYDEANGDLEKFKKNLGDWFDQAMERVSGWYRMKVQSIIRFLAFGLVVVVGADTLALTQRLWIDPALRARLTAAAQQAAGQPRPGSQAPEGSQGPAGSPPQAAAADANAAPASEKASLRTQVQAFEALNLPLTPFSEESGLAAWRKWYPKASDAPPSWIGLFFFWCWQHLLGFLVTAAAISLGAPFWFDVLNKLVDLRSSGKKVESATQPSQKPAAPAGQGVANQPA